MDLSSCDLTHQFSNQLTVIALSPAWYNNCAMWVELDSIPPFNPFKTKGGITQTINIPLHDHDMHSSSVIDTLRPAKILANADKLMEHARALYENYKQIMKPIDRTVAEDKMTLQVVPSPISHCRPNLTQRNLPGPTISGTEWKESPGWRKQSRRNYTSITLKMRWRLSRLERPHFSGKTLVLSSLFSHQRCVDEAIQIRGQKERALGSHSGSYTWMKG